MFIDTHTHLFHSRFAEEDPHLSPADLLTQAQQAGVSHLITIACRRQEWAPAQAFAAQHQGVSIGAGIHPQDVAAEPEITLAELTSLASNKHVVGLGETGLDYHYETSPKALQQSSFHTHLQAAEKTGLPVIIHTRDAEEDTVAILSEHKNVPFVFHCFTGTPWLAGQGVEKGGYISFSGILTFKKSDELRHIAATLPKDRVLIETDAPYLAPEPHRSRRNAPSLLPHTALMLAQVWNTTVEDVAQITTANARRLFTRLPSI